MAPEKSTTRRSRMMTINKVTSLVASVETKAIEIHTTLCNSKRFKLDSSSSRVNFDKIYEEIYEYVLIKKIDNRNFSYEAYYDETIKTHMINLVNFMIETTKLCVFATPNLMIPVRVPMLIENIKNLRLPRYMIYSILILGTQLLPESRVTRFLSAKKVGEMVNYIRKVLDDRQNKFKMNHLWCLQALLEQKLFNRFSHITHTDLMKCYSACIMLGLHKVDSSAYLGLKQSTQEQNEMEFKRRMFWMVYLNNSVQAGLVKHTIYDGFLKNANKLPKNDYEWRNGVEYKTQTLILVENIQLIRTSESRRVNSDITKMRCIVFGMHNKICAFRNRRSYMIKRDYQLDFKRYTDLSKQLNVISKMLRRYTFDTLQKLQLCENANFLIIDEATVKNLIFQLWSLHLALINSAVHLCMTEILYVECFYDEPWRVQVAKMLCIDHSLEGVKILKWGYANIPTQYMDLNLPFLIFWISLTLINAAYITDHSKYRDVIENRDFILMLLQKFEPQFPNRGIFQEFLTQIDRIKQYFYNTNRMISPVPSIIVNSAITEEDVNPWFILAHPSSAGSRCCLLSNNKIPLRVLSLTHYMHFSSTPVDFVDHEKYTNLVQSVNISLDFIYQKPNLDMRKKGQDKRKLSNNTKILLGRSDNIDTDNFHILNVCKPPEYYSWSKRSTRASMKSLFILLFLEYEVAGYGKGYTLYQSTQKRLLSNIYDACSV